MIFNNLIKFLTPDYKNLKNGTVFLWLFVLALFIRFPFFFRDYIDRDESTFILLAQSWVNGYLPYTQLWDLKPPLTFAFFAVIISVFGKSLFIIRFFGTLLVTTTAFFTFLATKQLNSKKVGFWSAWVCVMLLSMFGSLQGVMSEHICIAFFMGGLFILIRHSSNYHYFLAGLLMGISVMVKLNMAYPILLAGLFIVYIDLKNNLATKSLLKSILFGIGILLIILCTFLPYYLKDIPEVWWNSVVLAPLKYTQVKRYSVFKLAPIIILVTSFFFLAYRKKLMNFKDEKIILLCLTTIGVVLSFVRGGRVNGHYLIQLHPILIILVGIAVSQIPLNKKYKYQPVLFILIIIAPVESYIEYVSIIKHKIEKSTFYNGEGISAPKYILDNNLETKNILFLEYHIGYWKLNANPPTKAATHPSNITREELFSFYCNLRRTSLEELCFILEKLQPKTIVGRSNRSIFDPDLVEENTYINDYLEKHYILLITVEKADIYQRL